MVIRKLVIALLVKYSGKGFTEAEADIEGFKRGAKGASKGLTELQKETRKARAEAKALAKQEREAAKALRERERATAKAAKAAARAQTARARESAKMVSDAEKATAASKKLAKANATRIAQQLAKREKKVADALKLQARAAEKAARSNRKLRESQESAALAALTLAAAEDKAARETRRAGIASLKSSSGWGAAGAELATVATAAGAVAIGIGAMVAPVLLAGAKFQSLRAQLDNLLGSAKAGGDAFEFIQDFAAKTPFQLDEVTGAFVALQGRGIKPTERRLTALGDIASANKKTFDDIAQAALDASQGDGERLKEFGIKMKKNGDDVSLSFRGQTIAVKNNQEAIVGALTTLGEMDGIAGSMAVQMKTLTGQFSNARDSVDKFLNAAAQTGGLERAGEILKILGDKLINPRNARLFGEAVDEILTAIRDGLKDIDPGDITEGFRTLLDVMKLLASAVKPLAKLFDLADELSWVGDAADATIALTLAFEELVTGQLSVGEAATKTAMAFGLIDDAAAGATFGMDKLKKSALEAVEAVKKAVTNAFLKEATDEELKAVAANENANKSLRSAATKELSERKEKTKKSRALEARAINRARKDSTQRRREADAPGKGKKSKGAEFFDFAEQAKSAALAQGEEFAAEELKRLIDSGLKFNEAQKQAQAAGKVRAGELEAEFKRTGEITKGGGKNILDILGLKGPGSVLKGREAPSSLIISPNFKVTMIENFTQTIEALVGGKDALAEVTGAGGEAAVGAGVAQFRPLLVELVKATMGLEMDRLLKMDGGGVMPSGPEGA